MSTKAIRVLLIEDHGIVREGLKLILQGIPDVEVVGEAADGRTGVRLFEQLAARDGVDVVVTDLGLPDISGLEVTRQVKARHPATRVMILTMHNDNEHIRGMIEIGVDGYLLKQSAGQELGEAIHAVARGETVLAPEVTRWLMSNFRRGQERQRQVDPVTERERQVLRLLAEGATSKEIAQRLGLSTKTVENHRARILEKLGAANTVAAIGLAYQQGLIDAADVSDGMTGGDVRPPRGRARD